MADNLSKVLGNKVEQAVTDPDKTKQTIFTQHVPLLVVGKLTPKGTMVWLSTLFD